MTATEGRKPEDLESFVLLVEDDELIRELFTELLSLKGYTVVGAANGQDAIDRLKTTGRPCLVILDLSMPVMSGRELRAALLADAKTADVPVVVVSGAAEPKHSFDDLKAARVLTKPVRWPVLLQAVEEFCQRAS